MATALQQQSPPQSAECSHLAFNPYETLGGNGDPCVLERGKCCEPTCQQWLEVETDLMTGTTTYRPLEPATILRLVLDHRQEEEEFFV